MTAINFPDSPSDGATHVVGGVTYTYNSAETKWKTTINSNAFLPLTGGTVSGTLTVNDDLAVDTDTLFVDVSTDRVGINTASPGDNLEIAHADDEGLTFKATGTDGTTATQITYEDTNGGVGGVLQFDHDNNSFSFETAGSERARITSTGDLRFNSGYGSVATAFGVRAWINFDGTASTIGTGRGSGNMDAVTDNGTGDYTVNFTNDMPDANYGVIHTAGVRAVEWGLHLRNNTVAPTASAYRFWNVTVSDTASDTPWVCIAFVR